MSYPTLDEGTATAEDLYEPRFQNLSIPRNLLRSLLRGKLDLVVGFSGKEEGVFVLIVESLSRRAIAKSLRSRNERWKVPGRIRSSSEVRGEQQQVSLYQDS